MEKKFKPFDKVIVRDHEEVWQPDLYGFWDKCRDRHQTMMNNSIAADDLLPYEGNEHLVGTVDSPDEEIFINYGTELMAMTKNKNWIYATFVSTHCTDNYFTVTLSNGEDIRVAEICRFSDFNPNDMEETKKHILVVRNGKIVRYKG